MHRRTVQQYKTIAGEMKVSCFEYMMSISSYERSIGNTKLISYYIDMTFRNLLTFGPFPIRILAGIAFIVAGTPKLENISANQGFSMV